MEDTTRSEYPAMLANLQPGQAVQTLNDRIRRMNKINIEVSDWLQERRRVEEQYVQSLRKLMQFKVPNAQSELGIFQSSWDLILKSIESTAQAHQNFADRLERDVELALRHFANRREPQGITTMANNLSAMARELDDAQDKSDRMHKRAARANPQKLEAAIDRLDVATNTWQSQAPYIFESLQALDELRSDHLRDALTQMLTHDADAAQRRGEIVAEVLAALIEVRTADEVTNFATRTVLGKPKVERKAINWSSTAAGAGAGGGSSAHSLAVPSPGIASAQAGGGFADDDHDTSDMSMRDDSRTGGSPRRSRSSIRNADAQSDLSVFRRIGTVLNRRRQSVHGGFGQLSSGFSRNISSSHGREGRAVSPPSSSHNFPELNRLSSLVETPDLPAEAGSNERSTWREADSCIRDIAPLSGSGSYPPRLSSALVDANGTVDPSIFDMPPPSTAASAPVVSSHQEPARDSEGFTIPPPANDPISQAQREATGTDELVENLFKVSIQTAPVAEEDPEEKQAALSNVATTLSQMALPLSNRKAGTVRGRRDVRSTIYVPHPATAFDSESGGNNPFASSQPLPLPLSSSSMTASSIATGKSPSLTALASETSITGTSDTQSVRSANSLGSTMAHLQHPNLAAPGLGASVIEVVSAAFEDGVIKTVGVTGEIAFSYGTSGSPAPDHHETIRINNFPNLGSIGPNRTFVQNVSPSAPDQWTLDATNLTRAPTTAFSYRVFSEDTPSATPTPTSPEFPDRSSALARHVPLLLKPVWKPERDKLGILVQYGPNPACTLPGPVTLHNVVFVATYQGGRGLRAQTKPGGTHLTEKALVYWRLGDLTVDPATGLGEGKIVCRVFGADPNVELKPGHVEARWEFVPAQPNGTVTGVAGGISVSRLAEKVGSSQESDADETDPFADDKPPGPAIPLPGGKHWVEVPLTRKLVSGKYEARAPGALPGRTGSIAPGTPVMSIPGSFVP